METENRLEVYKKIKAMTEAQLVETWQEITDKQFWWYIECVIPARWDLPAVASGEPTCEGVEGTIHTVVCLVDGRCFKRHGTVELFNPARYITEIKKKFFPGKYPGRES